MREGTLLSAEVGCIRLAVLRWSWTSRAWWPSGVRRHRSCSGIGRRRSWVKPVATLLARDQLAYGGGMSGATVVARHRDGHQLDVRARVSALLGEDAAVRWCVLLDPRTGPRRR